MDFSNPSVLSGLVTTLRDDFAMSDAQSKSLHHRSKLPNGISAHLRYLGTVSELRGAHQQLARRFNACLLHLRGGSDWKKAARLAERDFPK